MVIVVIIIASIAIIGCLSMLMLYLWRKNRQLRHHVNYLSEGIDCKEEEGSDDGETQYSK